MGIKCGLVFSALLSIVLGCSQQGSAYQLTSEDFQTVHQITQIIQQAEYGSPASSHNQRFWEQYRALFNRQTSERKKRILFEVYYTGSYLAEEIGDTVEHTDLASLQILSDTYWKDRNHIYYMGYLQDGEVFDWGEGISHTLTGVDYATFQVYDTRHQIKDLEHSYNYQRAVSFEGTEIFVYYAKDKNHVYFNGLPIQGANPDTYEVLERGIFAKDDSQIFFRSWYEPYAPNIPLQGVDVETFEVLSWEYAKDKQNVYEVFDCGGGSGREACIERVKNADPTTFVVPPSALFQQQDVVAYDKNALYTRGGFRVVGGDSATFKIMSYQYAKDKNAVYCLGDTYPEAKKIPGAEAHSFQSFEDYSAKDTNHYYYQCKFAPETTTTLYGERELYFYFKRQEQRATKISDDIERLSDWSFYYADKKTNRLYVRKDRLEATDLPYSGFQLLTGEGIIAGFGKYENQLYFYGKLVPNVDLKSLNLHVLFGEYANHHIIQDKNAVYYVTGYDIQIITGADSATFTGITYHYAYPDGTSSEVTLRDYYQDKRQVYRTDIPMLNVDKASFQYLGTAYRYGKVRYSRDKTHVYANANIITGADVKTFRVVGGIERFDAMDKNEFYRGGEKVE